MAERRHDLYLLTPGPLTVSPEVKAEMLRDRSPGAAEHVGITAEIRRYLLEICNGTATHECIPVQGSATFAIEAGYHTLVPKDGKLLVIQNGWYGIRLREVAEAIRMNVAVLELPMLPLPTAADVEAAIDADPAITHIVMCHVDTGTGVLNPVAEIAEVAKRRGRRLMIDAVAAFGGFDLDVAALDLEAVFISPNKGLESVPGLGIGRTTPPTHVVAALGKAIERHKREGGCAPRLARYTRNWRRLVDGMRQRGFRTLLPDDVAAPIIATFMDPTDPNYSFPKFYAAMEKRGLVIFAGRLTAAGTFRIGCMGDIVESDITFVLETIDEALAEIGVSPTAPDPGKKDGAIAA